MNFYIPISKIIFAFIIIVLVIIIISIITSLFVIDKSEYIINSKKIPDSFDGYKILQISDLHNSSFGNNNEKLIEKVDEIKPDIIVLTGDMVNTNSKNYSNFYSLAENLANKYPIYYIMGNHEQRLSIKNQNEIINKLISLKINVLKNEKIKIQKSTDEIYLFGLEEPISTYKNALSNVPKTLFTLENINEIFPNIDKNNFNILLSHSPFDFEIFEKWGADLILSGHVHGGLVRLPFIGGILSPERTFFPKYDGGEYAINDSKMIVSRGLGNGTLNLRIFNNPELCIITLKKMD